MRNGTKSSPTVPRKRSKAAARALRRRDMRAEQSNERRPTVESSRRPVGRGTARGHGRAVLPTLPDGEKLWWMLAFPSRELLRRIPFVIGVIGLLAVGLAATLWLATRSTEDASALSAMRSHNRELQQEQERLERDMEQGRSVTELARRAGELGMVPVRDVARLVPQSDGSVQVVGELKPVEGGPEQPLDDDPANLPGAAKRQGAPAAPRDGAPGAVQTDEASVERVHPSQGSPAQGEAQEQAPAPNAPVLPPMPVLPPAGQAPPISRAGDQGPVLPIPQIELPPGAPRLDPPAPPAPEMAAPPAPDASAPEIAEPPVAEQAVVEPPTAPPAAAQPEQELHE